MSRTITIPANNNPFTVVINNTVYRYKGGETIEVPDEVADAIEDALDLVPKPKRYLSRFAQFIEGSITEITKSDLDGVEIISQCAFYNSVNIRSAVIPDDVLSIGYAAFGTCRKLESVTIGKGVITIGDFAFRDCAELKRVIMRPMIPPTIVKDTFINVPTTCVIEVPAESVEAYKAAPFWSALASQIKAIEE